MCFAFVTIFIACDFCERLSNEYDKICYEIEQIDWYLLPPKVQSMLPIIVCSAQQTFSNDIFGSVACNRETFKQVRFQIYTPVSFSVCSTDKSLWFFILFSLSTEFISLLCFSLTLCKELKVHRLHTDLYHRCYLTLEAERIKCFKMMKEIFFSCFGS